MSEKSTPSDYKSTHVSPPTKAKTSAGAKRAKRTLKHWVAYSMFAAIILVFVFWGIRSDKYGGGDSAGGVAAVVNDTPISLNEFRTRMQNVEANSKMKFDQFPEAQRRAFQAQLRQRTLNDLILGELVYQVASKRGVVASDAEVRDYILQIPFLQENSRFVKDRYRAFLQNMNMSTEEFERQVRKQIVSQRLQELFVGSATPAREELKRNQILARQKLNIRFVQVGDEDLKKPGFVSSEDIGEFLKSSEAEVEGYYKNNPIEFTNQEKVRARHILVRTDEKRSEGEAAKIAGDLRKKATASNFAKLASEHSDDPGSKSKGGDLGEFERGRMMPEFENAAFATKVGEISEPIKTAFGYHLIYVEKKMPGGLQAFADVRDAVARKLLVNRKQSEILAKIKTILSKGGKKDLDTMFGKADLKWQESGEFDLTSQAVPKLGESPEVVQAIMKRGKVSGLIPELIAVKGGHAVVEVISWKEAPEAKPQEGAERMLAYRKSNDLISAWSQEIEAKASVTRNPRIMAQ